MKYIITPRKWRPQKFSEVVGQEAVVKSLRNAVLKGKIPHALLFSGVKGVGKTTTARIFAKAINCTNLSPEGEPCNQCTNCIEITNGYSMNVVEIDGASNRGIDNIRDIRENTIYMPISGKYKTYIIDEVHMLTNEASNALLKTLEEPPPHIVFILATTEIHKVLPTIRSRCQHYVFRKIPNHLIVEQLKEIANNEKIEFTEEALYLIAETSEGSMRDAESLFDQLVLYTDGSLSEDRIIEFLGIPEEKYFEELMNSAIRKDVIKALKVVESYIEATGNLKVFIKNFLQFLKKGLIVKKLSYDSSLMDFSESKYEHLKSVFGPFSEEEILRIMDLFVEVFKEMRGEVGEKFLFEIALFKLMDYKNLVKISDVREEILEFLKSKPVIQEKIDRSAQFTENEKMKMRVAKTVNVPVTQKLEKTEENVKKVFYEMFSKNPLYRPLLDGVSFLGYSDDNIFLEISKSHIMEYFSKNKFSIEDKLSRLLGFKVNLELKAKNGEEVKNLVDVEKFKKKDEEDKRKKLENNTLTEVIKDIFNGEIEK